MATYERRKMSYVTPLPVGRVETVSVAVAQMFFIIESVTVGSVSISL